MNCIVGESSVQFSKATVKMFHDVSTMPILCPSGGFCDTRLLRYISSS